MSTNGHTSLEVMAALRHAGQEVPGIDPQNLTLLMGAAALRLDGGHDANFIPTPEEPNFDEPPRFAERAIKAATPAELIPIASEAIERLRRCLDERRIHEFDGHRTRSGELMMEPLLRGEGETAQGEIIGDFHIERAPSDPNQFEQDRGILKKLHLGITLTGGEDEPFNRLSEHSRYRDALMRHISFHAELREDPILHLPRWGGYMSSWARYSHRHRKPGEPDDVIFDQSFVRALDANAVIVKAEIFWALDMLITQYESVFPADWNTGLTYSDYRRLGCLDEQGRFDKQKADAALQEIAASNTSTNLPSSPAERDYELIKVKMDPVQRAYVRDHQDRVRELAASRAKYTHS